MANTIKFVTITPSGAGPAAKTFNFEDVPEGFNITQRHIRPIFARRLQNGSLVSQSLLYNKKQLIVDGGEYQTTVVEFFQDIYESGATSVFQAFNINEDFTTTTEFSITVQLIEYEDNKAYVDNTRSFTATFEEV